MVGSRAVPRKTHHSAVELPMCIHNIIPPPPPRCQNTHPEIITHLRHINTQGLLGIYMQNKIVKHEKEVCSSFIHPQHASPPPFTGSRSTPESPPKSTSSPVTPSMHPLSPVPTKGLIYKTLRRTHTKSHRTAKNRQFALYKSQSTGKCAHMDGPHIPPCSPAHIGP